MRDDTERGAGMVRMSVVAAAREDGRPVTDLMEVAQTADRLGYPEVWIGEGGTWDALVAAAAVGLSTDRIEITAGPVAVSVRDPITTGRGAATAATLTGRSIGVALGASSVRFVEGLHGRSRSRVIRELDESAAALARYLHQPTDVADAPGFRRKMNLPGGFLTVAAFGDRAIDIAARHADRMLLDLVTPEVVARLREKLEAAADRAARPRPSLAAWLPAAVDPGDPADRYVREGIAGYLPVRGYDDMFVAAGFDEAVRLAAAGHPVPDLVDALPDDAASRVGLVGDLDAVRARIRDYEAAGLDEIAVVPALPGDPGGARTLTALAPG
jgi:probable F420-dependent oxidoreductase